MYCYHEFKLSHLKNLKLFSIRVKKIIWGVYFCEEKATGCSSFYKHFFFFFFFLERERNRSMSDARCFFGKKRKIGKGNLYLTKNKLSRNEM